jgi:hypothetical protein
MPQRGRDRMGRDARVRRGSTPIGAIVRISAVLSFRPVTISAPAILEALDACCDAFTFPMLDNGYFYPAATRLSLFRSAEDWAMVIELFGFSPREGLPSIHLYSFASRLHDRDARADYVSDAAYANYLEHNPHNESRFINPVDEGEWLDPEDGELVAEGADRVVVRGKAVRIPEAKDYRRHEIDVKQPPRVQVFELCRYLAAAVRDDVLARPDERRMSVLPEMAQLLQLEEWHHPNVVDEAERPSGSETFQQLAKVLESGDVRAYRPGLAANTHWKHWPDGGTL